jgi:hypothetical protein
MLTRMRKHMSFANTMSVIALFIALGGSAYAAKKLNGKSIKNNSIPAKKLKANVLKNLDKCPSAAPDKTEGLCYGPQLAATDWDTANLTCASQKLRLPTIGEGLLVANKTASGQMWTDEVTELSGGSQRATVKGAPAPQIFSGPVAGPHPYRCILNATN